MEKILSIAIATYNMENYLHKCIGSLLVKEIINDIEILIINDGSTDNSLNVALEYQAKYPRSVRVIDKQNGGYGSAINMAIDEAQGKYFKTLDADDWFDSDALVEYINFLKNNNVSLVITHYSKETENNDRSFPIYYMHINYNEVYNFKDFCLQSILNKPCFSMHAITYNIEVLRKDNFRLSHCYYSDVDYANYPLVNVETVVFLDIVLYKYLVGRDGQSVSVKGYIKNYNDFKYISKKLIDYYSHCQAEKNDTISLNIGYSAVNTMNTYIKSLFDILYVADKKRAKKEIREFENYLKNADSDIYQLGMYKIKKYKRQKKADIFKTFLSRKKSNNETVLF